jgi:hypothetical protein
MTLRQKTFSTDFRLYMKQLMWHELGLISLLVMELMVILPWFRSFTPAIQTRNPVSSFVGLLFFFLLITFSNRILRMVGLRAIIHRLIQIALLLAGIVTLLSILIYPDLGLRLGEIVNRTLISFQNILEILPEGFILILMCIYLWWRGLVISSMGTLEIHSTERKFRFGILTLAAFGIIFRGRQIDYLITALPFYFAFGLLAVTFSRTSSLGRWSTAYRLPYTGGWFIGMSVITSITITAGIFMSRFLQSELAYSIYDLISEYFNKLLTLLEILLLPVVEIVVYLADKMVKFLSRYIDLDSIKGIFDQLQDQPTPELPLEQAEPIFTLSPEAIAVIVLLLLAILIFLLVRRANQQQRYVIPKIEDGGDTVVESGRFKSRIERLLDRVREGIETVQQFGFGRRLIAATIIRRIYTLLLNTAADLGQPRHVAETPYEFQQKLVQLFPNQIEQIGLITNAYVQVRYGEIPEEERIVARVEEAWSSIEKEARRMGRDLHPSIESDRID